MKLLISILLVSLTGCATYHYDAPTMTSEEIRQNYIRETGRISCVVCDGSVDESGANR
jgi:cytochrome c-type biogenesis protein CcmH/NrfF